MTDSKNTKTESGSKALSNDLGLFYRFCPFEESEIQVLTIEQIEAWVNDTNGIAIFWPFGDHDGVLAVFGDEDPISFTEIKKLDQLIDELGDEPETFARIAWFKAEGYMTYYNLMRIKSKRKSFIYFEETV